MSISEQELLRLKDKITEELKKALSGFIGASYGGTCSDQDLIAKASSFIEYQPHFECGHLEASNEALGLSGCELDLGHTCEDAPGEMLHLADAERRQQELYRARRIDPVWR